MNISLLANNRYVNEYLVNYCALNSDLLVVFNHAYLLNQYHILQKHPMKYFFLRSNQTYMIKHHVKSKEIYFGENNINKYNWEKIVFVGGTIEWYNMAGCSGMHIQESKLLEKYNIKMKTDPSVGFIGYLAMRLWFPQSNITLVGFTGRCPSVGWHDLEFEQRYYRKNNVKMLDRLFL